MGIIIVVAIVLFLLWFFVLRKFKVPKITAIVMFTGGVKVGKSAVSLYFAVKTWKRKHRKWRVNTFFAKLFRRALPEEPLFYSNIPLRGIAYVPVTRDHLLRKVRFNFGSVVFLDEASLVADSMLSVARRGKEDETYKINDDLLLFFKLFGHETHGGNCIINSQCITDLHYALKRCTSNYFYIHHLGWFPFLRIPAIREEVYSEDGTKVNAYTEDVEQSMKRVLMSARIFKKYDSYCYSWFTDDLPVNNDIRKYGRKDSLKAQHIVSFRPLFDKLQKQSAKREKSKPKKIEFTDVLPSLNASEEVKQVEVKENAQENN